MTIRLPVKNMSVLMGIVLSSLVFTLYYVYIWYPKTESGSIAIASNVRHIFTKAVGTHHKTGTQLTSLLLHVINATSISHVFLGPSLNSDSRLGVDLYSYVHGKEPVLADLDIFDLILCPCSSFVHMVRDPVDVIISAYLYHKSGPDEAWLYDHYPHHRFAKWLLLSNTSMDDLRRYLSQSKGSCQRQQHRRRLVQEMFNISDNSKNKSNNLHLRNHSLPIYVNWCDLLNILPPHIGLIAEMNMACVTYIPGVLTVAQLLNIVQGIRPVKAHVNTTDTVREIYLQELAERYEQNPFLFCTKQHRQQCTSLLNNNYKETPKDQTVLQVRLEDFAQPHFDDTVRTMIRFFGYTEEETLQRIVNSTRKYDVSRMSSAQKEENSHITSGKERMSGESIRHRSDYKNVILEEMGRCGGLNCAVLLQTRKILGYEGLVSVISRT